MTIYPKLKEVAEVLAEVVEVELEKAMEVELDEAMEVELDKAMEVELDEADEVVETRVVVVSTTSHQTEVLI